jgi:hypothetical protein
MHGSSLPSRNWKVLKTRLAFISGLIASFAFACALAQEYKPFPGIVPDQRTQKIQEDVESIYESGDHRRALLIYEEELAPIGDKYAQYMVGYMHLKGEGTEPDRIEALAWYRLAAERDEALLVTVRDELQSQMTREEIEASDEIFIDIWKEIGDRELILALVRRDLDTLREQTGTRIPGARPSSPNLIIRLSGETYGPSFYDDVRHRVAARIEYLDAHVEISDAVLAEEFERVREEEARIKEALSAMEN